MAHARSCTAHLEELAVAGVSLEHGAVGLVGDPVGALDAADGAVVELPCLGSDPSLSQRDANLGRRASERGGGIV